MYTQALCIHVYSDHYVGSRTDIILASEEEWKVDMGPREGHWEMSNDVCQPFGSTDLSD